MKECVQPYFLKDGEILDSRMFREEWINEGLSVYEVIRLVKGGLLFAEDHLRRLFESMMLAGTQPWITPKKILLDLNMLVERNGIANGNIKLVMNITADGAQQFLGYFVAARYPVESDYLEGVKVITYPFHRDSPNKKIWRPEFRRAVAEAMKRSDAFEALLMDGGNTIPEASKANIFGIRNGSVITPPDDVILQGITRKYVIRVCMDVGLKVVRKNIYLEDLPEFEAMFLTGTSLYVLPIRQVDQQSIPVDHPAMRKIMNAFSQVVRHYLGVLEI